MNYQQRPKKPTVFENLLIRQNQQSKIDLWLRTLAEKRGQRPYLPPRHEQIVMLVKLLYQVFKGKCAYCETPLVLQEARVAFFRPLEYARQESIDDAEHYFWLLWDWSNLHLACRTCRDNKGTHFPIRAENRAELGTSGAYRLKLWEKPFLLDPCLDNPAMHIEFNEDGTVSGKSDPGKETIAALDLNRENLCLVRKTDVQALHEVMAGDWDAEMLKKLQTMCRDDQPFTGMRRQFVRQWLQIKYSSPDTPKDVKAVLEEREWQSFLKDLDALHYVPMLVKERLQRYIEILAHPLDPSPTLDIQLSEVHQLSTVAQEKLHQLCQDIGIDTPDSHNRSSMELTDKIVNEATQTPQLLNDVLTWLDDRDPPPPPPIKNRWALLVGINEYDDDAFPDLKFCINDVLALQKLLEGIGYTVIVLHDHAPQRRLLPSRTNIKAELARLCQVMDEDDLLYVHFAGHGMQHNDYPALITSDTRATILDETALALADLKKRMQNGRTRRLVLTLDACHVGVDIGRNISDYEQFIRHVFELAEGFAVIAGSTAQQAAHDWKEKEHGVFTYYLIQGLRGAAMNDYRLVTVDSLKSFVLDKLCHWNVQYGGLFLQELTADIKSRGDMILVDYRGISPPIENGFESREAATTLQDIEDPSPAIQEQPLV